MLGRGPAKRLTVYLNEGSRHHGRPLYEAILEVLLAKGLAGGTVVRALAGFTRGGGMVSQKILDTSVDLPLRIEVVDTAEAIERVLPDLYLMLDKGLIAIDDVHVVKYTGRSAASESGAAARPRKVTMQGKQLRIHISADDTYAGEPLHEAIVKRFAAEEFAGITVYRGLEGFGAEHKIHRDGVIRHGAAPMVLIMIDTGENVARARAILDGMLEHGVVVVSDVEATFYGRSAEGKGGAPAAPAATD
jgi:PII-like signaling protein